MDSRKRFFLSIFSAIVASTVVVFAAEPVPTTLPSPRGVSTTFLKRLEIVAGNTWKAPMLSPEAAAKGIGRYDAVWCALLIPAYNQPAWNYLRQHRPDILMLHYMSGDSTRTYDDGWFSYKYVNEQHPEWFILKDTRNPLRANPRNPDNRVRWNPSDKKAPDYNRFYLDVANKKFQEWAADRILECVSGKAQGLAHPYDGFGMDNVNLGMRRMGDLTGGYPNWTYARDIRAWDQGYLHYLRTVKKRLNEHGFILVANHTLTYGRDEDPETWRGLLESVDGLMTEQALMDHRSRYYENEEWLSCIKKHEEVLKKGLIDWWVCYPPENDPEGYERFMYTYCSWLLVKQPGKSFYYATRGNPDWNTPQTPWYDEYDFPIGRPVSDRYAKGGCWWRDYAAGKVVVNPTDKHVKVVIDRERYWLDAATKKAVFELDLSPETGRLLLPTAYKIGEPIK